MWSPRRLNFSGQRVDAEWYMLLRGNTILLQLPVESRWSLPSPHKHALPHTLSLYIIRRIITSRASKSRLPPQKAVSVNQKSAASRKTSTHGGEHLQFEWRRISRPPLVISHSGWIHVHLGTWTGRATRAWKLLPLSPPQEGWCTREGLK